VQCEMRIVGAAFDPIGKPIAGCRAAAQPLIDLSGNNGVLDLVFVERAVPPIGLVDFVSIKVPDREFVRCNSSLTWFEVAIGGHCLQLRMGE
jgi:hypothetical protein